MLGFGIASREIQERYELEPSGRWSILIDIDLASGDARHTPIAAVEAHEPVLLPADRLACVSDGGETISIIDALSHAVIQVIRCQPGFEYSGHARRIDGRMIVTARARGEGNMRGQLEIFDESSLALRGTVDTGGHVPHEIVLMEDRDELAISHYGHYGGGHFTREPFYWDIREPAVTILDRRTLSPKRRFVYDRPLALTHMRRAGDGLLYVVAAQYVRNNPEGLAALPASQRDGLQLSPLEERSQRIGVPGPVVVIDPDRGVVRELMPEPQHHRKQQSLAVHEQSGHVFVTFTYSDQLMRITPGSSKVDYFSATHLGLVAPCGVVDLAGTPYVAVSGRDAGLSIVHAASGEVLRTDPTAMFSNVHLGYAPA